MIKRKQGENEALEILENIGIEMDEEGFTEMMVRFNGNTTGIKMCEGGPWGRS